MSERNQLIDFLRGFSIIAIILTHANAFFLRDNAAFILWNISQFSVPVFIFCSVYLFLKKSLDTPVNYFSYLKKRFTRLLVPYYIFLGFFIISLLVIAPKIVTAKYIWQSLLVIGGVDINWLVLLFLYITILLPFFVWSFKKSIVLFWLFFVISLVSTFFLLFYSFGISYKWTMWLPWSVMIYFTYFYIKFERQKKTLVVLFFMSLMVLMISFVIQNQFHHNLVFRENKYPPNIFYLSFGASVILGLSLSAKYILQQKLAMKILDFFSKHSYSIYFIHYTVLTILVVFIRQLQFNWLSLFLTVLIITVILQKIINLFKLKL